MSEEVRLPAEDPEREEVVARGELQLAGPPKELNVIHQGGFTAITYGKRQGYSTLWRPADVLKKSTQGTLCSFNRKSFYQQNNNVTRAVYKVPGYRYRIMAWFDNETGKRIA